MVIVFNRPARLPPSCGAAFRSARSHSFCAGSYLLSVSSRAWREGRPRLAANFLSIAPRHVGIGYTESVIIHGLFALFARHVPAANDASLCAPGIRRRFSDRRRCAERHSDTEQDERYGRWSDEVFEGHDCSICMMHALSRDMGLLFAVTSSTFA